MDQDAPKPPSDDLAPEERERLLGRYGRRFVAGEAIFREGAPAREAFLLHDGRVRLLKRVRMIERSLMVLRTGDLFGESALLDEPADGSLLRSSTALALTDGVVLALDRATFRALVANHPSVASRVTEQLVRRLRDAEDQIEILMLQGTQSKIVNALLKLAERGAPGTGDAHAQVAVSPVELSVRVGLDVETVKRTVQRLRDKQYLRIVGERIEIPDLNALRRLYVLLGTKDELRGDDGAPRS